jgi:Transcriptional regulators
MFTYDVIQKFNDTEIHIYKFIVANLDKIPYMTIRELSELLHISTSTVLRFCEKVNCGGYNEFKEKMKEYLKTVSIKPPMEDLEELQHYFHGVNTSAFEEKIRIAVEKIRTSELIAFIGIGSSGTLAKYGARFFSNLGKFAVGLEDNYYPICDGFPSNTVIIALSESGESKELINMISAFLQKGYYIMSVTNHSQSTLSAMSDWNISYNMKRIRVNGGFNATTQVPVLFILEAIARRL